MDNDICLQCNHAISENDKRMEMPCCDTVYHTICAKNMINEAFVNNYNNIICSCGELFISLHQNWIHNTESTNTVIPENVREKIADFKATLVQFKKNRTLFIKKIKEESSSYKEDIEPLLEQIKERRKIGLEAIKDSDIYKSVSSIMRNLKTKLTKINNIFAIDRETTIKELYGGNDNLYYDVKYLYILSKMRRAFRIRYNI